MKKWGNICGVGPSTDKIQGHWFVWPDGDNCMRCMSCGFRWNGKSRWFGKLGFVEYCTFNDIVMNVPFIKPTIWQKIFPTRFIIKRKTI